VLRNCCQTPSIPSIDQNSSARIVVDSDPLGKRFTITRLASAPNPVDGRAPASIEALAVGVVHRRLEPGFRTPAVGDLVKRSVEPDAEPGKARRAQRRRT
jgi:hypothetical protein